MYKTVSKSFEELSLNELYDILAARQAVFVVEQNCPFLDTDHKDQVATHCLLLDEENKLGAYTRIFDVGVYYPGFASIGRVLSLPHGREKGYGRGIMNYSIAQVYDNFGQVPIKIGAQKYLIKFYSSLGFEEIGEDYMEDGIPHTIMIKKP
jgi:ElaA protein